MLDCRFKLPQLLCERSYFADGIYITGVIRDGLAPQKAIKLFHCEVERIFKFRIDHKAIAHIANIFVNDIMEYKLDKTLGLSPDPS